MRSFSKRDSIDHQVDVIESKRRLLAYIRSDPHHLTIESYICLTRILSDAGWRFADERWVNREYCLPTLEAAAVELERQINAERDGLLRQTVTNYRPASG